ncbi:histidine kinase [Dactylosporangium sp. NPDC049525]|uniref:sensor histidine kinase n=1 Tax=Dactylosporangium sp. NPDC049525 TaxID=3154730 RepID=UPI0034259DA2
MSGTGGTGGRDGGARIRWARQVRLPVALTVAQLAVWPLGPLAFGASVDPVRAWQVMAITAAVGVALSLRAVAPVAAWAVTLTAVSCADPLGLQDEALIVPFGDLLALYAVAVHRTLRVSVLCVAAGTVVSTLVADVLTEPDTVTGSIAITAAADAALSAVAYTAVVVFGRSRRRRTARREAVRVHVAGAAEHERAAAAHERERLSQELHDVSAHHLTAVVVQLAAAQRLRDPASATQALDVARTSGRAAARSLHRLVALAGRDEAPAPAGIPDLVAGFARLGLRVEVRPDPDGGHLHPDVAETAHLIVREALTNALRYAPGAAVTVAVTRSGDAVTVAIDDTGPETIDDSVPETGTGTGSDASSGGGASDGGGAAGFDLGSGAGIPGMRARAARLRGTLTAGPRPAGGWSVRAVLPASPDPVRPAPPASSAPWWRNPTARVLDVLLIVLVAGLPLFLAAAVRAEEGGGPPFAGPADAAMTLLFLIVYCGPLWWRRRAPVPVLAALLVVGVAAAVLSRVEPAATGFGVVVPLTLAGIVVPVYAAGRYDTRHPGLTWLAGIGAGAGAAVALVIRFVQPADLAGDGTSAQLWPAGAVFITAMTAGALSLLALPWWLAGFLVARHHARADRQDRVALRDVAERAVRAARDERARIAEGLRGQVLSHTSALLVAAGDPEGGAPVGTPGDNRIATALGHARAALTAMRELLTVLRVSATTGPRAAQPTLAGLAELCGPEVALEVHGAGQVPLEVELCAFRVVEAVLPIGAAPGGPALVRLEHGPDALRLCVRRLAGPVPRPVLAALRERVDAVGGSLATTRPGAGWQLDASLPVTEVVPS